jgi:hypothetical protein
MPAIQSAGSVAAPIDRSLQALRQSAAATKPNWIIYSKRLGEDFVTVSRLLLGFH